MQKDDFKATELQHRIYLYISLMWRGSSTYQQKKSIYSGKLAEMAQKWSAPFTRVTSTKTLCLLHTVYDLYSGVINNQAKGLNYVLKQLQEWKEAPVDCMILALHYLQGYYQVEIAYGH